MGEAGSPGAGTGDVVGPAAATNNGFVKFNGTTGKLLKDSAATISVADGGTGIPSYAAGDILYATSVTTLAKLPKGSALQALRMNAGATAPEWAGGGGAPDAVMEDQKASGTNGGSFNSGSWITRTLNTEVRDPFGLISLASNQFTPTVDGWVEWECPAQEVERHQSRLFNVTDAVAVQSGTSAIDSHNNEPSVTISAGGGAVEAGKTYRIEHRCSTGSATGFGTASGFGTEVYTRVKFWSA
jgi:hypothetical protein